jgi:transcriptional regulator of acetoin/glycerol metabolism
VRENVLRELRALRERYEREVRALIAAAVKGGERSQDIAEALGVSRATLWRRYREQMRR